MSQRNVCSTTQCRGDDLEALDVGVALASTSSSAPPPAALTMDIVQRSPGASEFTLLPKCWAVERTYRWLMHHRRLACDCGTLSADSEAMIHLAMTSLMAPRLNRRSRHLLARPNITG
jgi:transposase